ncbi:uncharacterized protein LOC752412 [Strongylocentrotus purpuratus]|uniref:Uncharacterized protein n=1 Tax=Strongylocentrotus purpuratus TaxID=7668 RepID=A0A7M7P2T7_STRPU|nr:uncharacterized protein LOC752412 [Strongylocentrotus purpuratus]
MASILQVVTATLLSSLALLVEKALSQTTESMNDTVFIGPNAGGQVLNFRYLSKDERAALWACFLGGLMALVGAGIIYYEYRLKKYEQNFPYRPKKKSRKPKTVEETSH